MTTPQTPLRLFGIRLIQDAKPLPDLYFPNKAEARAKRDALNAQTPNTYCITLGPDHRRFVR